MNIDDMDLRDQLARIAADVHYSADGQLLIARGQRTRRRRHAVLVISAGLAVALIVGVSAGVAVTTSGQHAAPAHSPERLAPLADVSATPSGWSPVPFRDGQVSVPSGWLIEAGGMACGSVDQGRVYVNLTRQERVRHDCESPAANVVAINVVGAAPVPSGRSTLVNGIPVILGSTTSEGHTTYVERGLGLDIIASGPLAQKVLATITHSTQSVVLNSSDVPTPKGWRTVTFGGLRFSTPSGWKTLRNNFWPGCPFNLTAQQLVLQTADQLALPSCPFWGPTAGSAAGVAGLLVAAGPKIDNYLPAGADCLSRNGLRICLGLPATGNGANAGTGLATLDALVYVPGQQHPDEVRLGMSGTGLQAAQIFDSIQRAP